MTSESSARARPPAAAGEDDYRSFCAALETSARGRAFLTEYARRNRQADTEMLLAALERLEARLRTDGTALARLRDEMRGLLIAIRIARPEIDAAGAPAKVAQLGKLLDLMERRLDAMVDDSPAQLAAPTEVIRDARAMPEPLHSDSPESNSVYRSFPRKRESSMLGSGSPLARGRADGEPNSTQVDSAIAVRAHLAVVPPPEQPELPIPSPAATPPAPLALVQRDAAPASHTPTAAFMPEVTLFGSAPVPRKTVIAAPATSEKSAPAPRPAQRADAALQAAAAAPAHPLALIMALSEEERIALFT